MIYYKKWFIILVAELIVVELIVVEDQEVSVELLVVEQILVVEMLENLEDLFVEMLEDHVEWWVDEVKRKKKKKCMVGVRLGAEKINH